MIEIFSLGSKTICKRKRIWLAVFISSIVLYLLLCLLFLFLHQRKDGTIFLVITIILTIAEAFLFFFYLLYERKRLTRYAKLIENANQCETKNLVYVKESDEAMQDYLTFRQVTFADETTNQEYSFYLLNSYTADFISGKQYKVKYCSRYIFGLKEQNNEK